jgi:ADP-ribose pyrophosphatase
MKKPIGTVSSSIAWSCPWYNIRQDEILLPDGSSGTYNIVQKAPSVWIVPVTADGKIVLLRQYRYTVDDWCWEVPAGSVKHGQTPWQAAITELREETGGFSRRWTAVGPLYTANGICNEVGHIFVAHDVKLQQPAHEPAEVIKIHLKPAAEALQMAQENQINDGLSALALLLSQAHLPPRLHKSSS